MNAKLLLVSVVLGAALLAGCDRMKEPERLPEIDGTRSRQLGAEDGRDQRRVREAVDAREIQRGQEGLAAYRVARRRARGGVAVAAPPAPFYRNPFLGLSTERGGS